ncbi:hypothetical protein PoB_001980000 [Plakobranchus ocellatus]|uniref:Uncharacterized protein n=1 Tax=Plakobranchus ocellatus TaxID=259542 RepID=A0AAV3ZFD2_9GAST|nr:hypothetical protein PoB_001980000 [Plakobranchus ocellatus]
MPVSFAIQPVYNKVISDFYFLRLVTGLEHEFTTAQTPHLPFWHGEGLKTGDHIAKDELYHLELQTTLNNRGHNGSTGPVHSIKVPEFQ